MKLIRLITIFLLCMTASNGFSQAFEIKKYSIADGLPSNLISCAEQDKEGLLWIGTWRGLCCFDGYEFISFNNVGDEEERPMCSRLHSIKIDRDRNIWCVTYDRRAYLFNTTNCAWTDVSKVFERKFGAEFRVRNIYPLESGVVWLTCYEEENFTFRIADISDLESVTNEFGRMDDERNSSERELWNKNKRENPDVSHVPDLADARRYIVDGQNNIWHLDHQMTRITPREVQFEIREDYPGKDTRTLPVLADIEGKPVYSTLTDSHGRKWVGTKGGRLYLDGKKQEIKGSEVYDIFEDSHGHVWVACFDEGINLLLDGKFVSADNRLRNYPKDKHAKVRHITETSDGVIFLSTADGIVCFSSKFNHPEDIRFHTYSQSRDKAGSLQGGNVMQTLQASDGRIYISTMTGGLIAVKEGDALNDDLVFEPVGATQDTDGIVLSFIEDGDGCLWLARENYLEKYNPREDRTIIFRSKDFCREVSFSEALPVISQELSADGIDSKEKITFGIYGGTLSFDPKQLVKSDFIPRILFSYVQFQGSQERQPVLYARELDVPADKRDLTIFFSALDYQDNELVQYAYKVVAADYDSSKDDGEGWSYVGRSHCASFNNLPCGNLRLLVRSTNADGVWMDNVAELRIYSHPTFWETPWAWLLYIIIIIGIVSVAVYIAQMRNRHRREREEMERKFEALLQTIERPETYSCQPNAHAGMFSLPEVQIEPEEKKMMERLMEFLNENIRNSELKIADLSDAVGLSRTVFYERIKAVTGMSPVDFLRYLRIQRAKQLIQTTDLPVSQIAYEIGFSDPNYFSKVFKKTTGMSPTDFKAKG